MFQLTHNIYAYLRDLHTFVQSQDARIRNLEKTVKALQKELSELKARPPVHVGKIEYKFDQLKVETLEGTLNIGLTPSNLEGIEEFEVGNKTNPSTISPSEQMERTMELEESIYGYLNSELEPLVRSYEKQLGIQVDSSYIDFIREDILKQLPNRIDFYFKQIPLNQQIPEARELVKDQIEKQLKSDIENAVLSFLKNLPNQRKE